MAELRQLQTLGDTWTDLESPAVERAGREGHAPARLTARGSAPRSLSGWRLTLRGILMFFALVAFSALCWALAAVIVGLVVL